MWSSCTSVVNNTRMGTERMNLEQKKSRKSKKREYGNKIDIQLRNFEGLAIEETPEALLTRSCG